MRYEIFVRVEAPGAPIIQAEAAPVPVGIGPYVRGHVCDDLGSAIAKTNLWLTDDLVRRSATSPGLRKLFTASVIDQWDKTDLLPNAVIPDNMRTVALLSD